MADDDDFCWNIRPVRIRTKHHKGQASSTQTWRHQAAKYRRSRRRDGFPIWKFVENLGEPRVEDMEAIADGVVTGLPKDPFAKHNGLSLRLSDALSPDEETLCRLAEPKDFVFIFGPARNPDRRIVGIAQMENGTHRFLRRVCSCSWKQVEIAEHIAREFGMGTADVESVPRLPGKELLLDGIRYQ